MTGSDSVTAKYSTRILFNPENIPPDSDSIPVRLLREAGSNYIRLYSLVHLQQGLYKVPFNFIFFPTHFFKSWFSSLKFLSPSPSSSWYSSQQPKCYRENYIASPFSFFHVIFFPTAGQWYSVPLFTTWYSSPTDLINFKVWTGCPKLGHAALSRPG